MSSFSPSGQTALYAALTNKTNTHSDAHALNLSRPIKKRSELSSDSETDASPRKRLRLDSKICSGSEDEELVNGFIRSYTMDFPRRRRQIPTAPILKSFVSSRQTDVSKCQSLYDPYLTPPYACAYSNASRRGSESRLAVATEQGAIQLFDTRKREPWDETPPPTIWQPHTNGIFDIQWSASDDLLATASGDRSVKITSVQTGTTLYSLKGHAGTVKCISWDSRNPQLLSTGGRDGFIHLWDLRLANRENVIPSVTIASAHEDVEELGKTKVRRAKNLPPSRTVTGILQNALEPHQLISSGSADGILRSWDMRSLTETKAGSKVSKSFDFSPLDPTCRLSSKRGRGIVSLVPGTGPTSGCIFALGADSQIYVYSLPTLESYSTRYGHPNLQASSSFYLRLSISPCGRWLASGSTGNAFLFDVSSTALPFSQSSPAVELPRHNTTEKVGTPFVDWADGLLATCVDDGTVAVWRPDVEVHRECTKDPEAQRWHWAWAA